MKLSTCWLMIAALVVPAVPAFPQEKQADSNQAAPPKLDQAALEKQFSEKLTGAALVGSFTIDGQDLGDLKTERYELYGVTKVQGDLWRFDARIKYGDNDLRLPIPLRVVWAGDTPIITMTDMTIPPLGTFTCRVMFYGDRYAGTWQHDQVGGHMFGRIEKAALSDENDKAE